MALSEPEILNGIAEILNEDGGVPAEAVQLDRTFEADLGVDPSTMAIILATIQARFGVPVPMSDAEKFRTVGDAVSYLQASMG